MKLLHVEIRSCRECPCGVVDETNLFRTCEHPQRGVVWDNECPDLHIPEWCPLPDAAAKEPEEYPETCPECGQSMER